MKQFMLRMPDDLFDWLNTKETENRNRQDFVRQCLESVRLGKTVTTETVKGFVLPEDLEAWVTENGGAKFLARLLTLEKKKAEERRRIAELNAGNNPFQEE